METIIWFGDLGREAVEVAGGKGANLGELTRAGLPVPPGFVVTTSGYDWFVHDCGLYDQVVRLARDVPPQDTARAEAASAEIRALFAGADLPGELAGRISGAYADLTRDRTDPAVAVRSSATAEDLAGASFAGQQDTYLDVSGADAVLGRVRDCWASLWTPRAIAYRQREGIDPAEVKLAVVIQVLVDAESAGVLFTANPVNGRRDQVVISAAWGLGESVVGGTVGTDSLVVQKTGPDHKLHVVSVEVGDQQVRTTRAPGGGTSEQPTSDADRHRRVLTDTQAVELAGIGVRIARHYGQPMDIEWARADGRFAVVQARPITALPEPVGDAPTDWTVPERHAMYARASIIEQLPEPLTPLFGDMIQPAVSGSLSKLMQTVFGSAVPAGGLTFPLVNGYAYYAYTWPTVARMSALAPFFLPRLFGHGDGNAEQRWRDDFRPRYRATVAHWSAADHDQLGSSKILHGVSELLFAGAEYYTSVQMIIPIAASTESIFTALYDTTAKRPGDPGAATFVMGADSSPLRAERELYGLAQWTATHADLLAVLATGTPEQLTSPDRPDPVDDRTWTEWRRRLDGYLDRYGHAVYDLDFANPVAADSPGPVLDTIRFYVTGRAEDPTARQARMAAEREQATTELLGRLDPVRRAVIAPVLARAQEAAPIREDALADVGLAWPTIRRLLLRLGQRLVDVGVLAAVTDVFWLHLDEVTPMADALDRRMSDPRVQVPHVTTATLDERKMTWRGRRLVSPPQLLPDHAINHVWDRFMPQHSGNLTGPVLTGLGASGGTVTAVAHVITDQADFASMEPGQVLVAKITTPAYTPLFALAAAVVTDVGGPLSHSSIVAREYGIPAVLGTGSATTRIRTGQVITVDGSAGTVTLPDDASGAPEGAEGTGDVATPDPAGARWRRVGPWVGVAAGAVAVVAAIARRRRR